jgi:pimeloyl-ACP methyl ester carboxylesterase
MMSSSGYQHVNGLKLFVHRYRDEAAPPTGLTIVLVHGFMDSGATWDMVAPALAHAGHDVVAPDLRGFGLSEYIGAGGYYHFPDYVADLSQLVDALAPRRLAIVGHSMGGTVAALYAGANPDRVERLALLEGTGPVGTEPALAVDRMQAWLRTMRDVQRAPKPLSSLKEAVERLSLHHPRVPREVIETRAKLLTRVDDAGRLLWAYDPLHRTTAPTPFHADAFREFLRRIDCPTLVVSGGAAGWHPPDEAERIACLQHAVCTELPTAGHMMHWTTPGPLAQRLALFFGEAPPVKKQRAPGSTRQGIPEPTPSTPGAGAVSSVGAGAAGSAGAAAGVTVPGAPPHSAAMGVAVPVPVPVASSAATPPVVVAVAAAVSPGTTAPGKPIYGGAAADLGGPVAGAGPAAPTRPSSGMTGSGNGGG